MSAEQDKGIIRRYYEELWNRWDLAVADEIIDEDIRFRGSLAVTAKGRAEFQQYVQMVRRAFPDFTNTIEELIAEDHKVVARLTYHGTHQGELFGVAPTGRRVEYSGVAIFRLSAGKIIEGYVLGDTLGLMRQLGAPQR